ncbi:unnamed protein product [Amoebophrya sp. A120]|nr:unnamed protein product [Amoebophrya sp. A120]|eukprot:GSA120T00017739001.1
MSNMRAFPIAATKDHHRKDFSRPDNEVGTTTGMGREDYEHLKSMMGDRGGHRAEESHRVRAPGPMAAMAPNFGLVQTMRRGPGLSAPVAVSSPSAVSPETSPTAAKAAGPAPPETEPGKPPSMVDSASVPALQRVDSAIAGIQQQTGVDLAAAQVALPQKPPAEPPSPEGPATAEEATADKPFEVKTRRQRLYEEKQKQISDFATRKRFVDFCVEFLDTVRGGEFNKCVRILDTIQQVDRVRDPEAPGGRTFFMQTRMLSNNEKSFHTYDDTLFEVVNYVDPRNNFTPLLWACMHDDHRIADLLLTCKANPQVQHPLKKCVIWNRPMCAEVLVRHGADKLQRDETGKIPFDYIGVKKTESIWNKYDKTFFLMSGVVSGACSSPWFCSLCFSGCNTVEQAHKCNSTEDAEGTGSEAGSPQKIQTAGKNSKKKLAAKVFDTATQKAAEKQSFLEDDQTFMRELLKPTEEDYVFLRKKQQENELKPIQLWASSLEETAFVQDLTQPPLFFAITADSSVTLREQPGFEHATSGGNVVKAAPGTMWQQIGIEPVYGEPLCHWVCLSNGMPGVKGWTLWDRRAWHHEATRLGIHTGDKNSSKTLHKEMSLAFVNMTLASAQQSDAWKSVPDLMPIQIFNSMIRKIVQPKSAVPLRARSGPTLADCCIVTGPAFKVGESVLCAGQIVLDGGWVFYQVKRRHYGELNRECNGNGWLCARAKDYVTVVLKA